MPIRTGRHGRVDYADPGYLEDGQPRYPLDTVAHVRNAPARFAEFHDRYTAEQQRLIAGRIGRAERRHGVHGQLAGRHRRRPDIKFDPDFDLTENVEYRRGYYGTGIRNERAARRDIKRRFGSRPAEEPVSRPGARFYVTARQGDRTAFLLGPYSSHMSAQAHVDEGRRLVEERTREGKYGGVAIGTSSVPGASVRTLFGHGGSQRRRDDGPAWKVHTPRGYVGRRNLDEQLRDDMPRGFASEYTLHEAREVAKRHHGWVEEAYPTFRIGHFRRRGFLRERNRHRRRAGVR